MDRRALIVSAVGIGLVAVVLVFAVGLRPITGFPNLSPLGEYEGAIAYNTGGIRDTCVHAIDLATAQPLIDPYCADWVGLNAFTSEGVYVDDEAGFWVIPFDSSEPQPASRPEFPDEEPFERELVEPSIERSRRVLVIDGVTVLEVDGPGDYELHHYEVSPDGSQVMAFDSVDRLMVAKTDGSGIPMLVTDNADWGMWQARPSEQ